MHRGRVLAQAIEIEAETFLAEMRDLKHADDRDRIVGMVTARSGADGGSGPCQSAREHPGSRREWRG